MIAWLTAGVAAIAGLWTLGLASPWDHLEGGDPSLPWIVIPWLGSPYLAFSALAYAWRRSRVASWLLLGITIAVAGFSTWIYSQLLRPGNEASLAAPWLPIYQWYGIAGLLAAWLSARLVGDREPISSDQRTSGGERAF